MPTETDVTLLLPNLSPCAGKPIIVRFDGGSLSPDGGLLALREVEARLGAAGRTALYLALLARTRLLRGLSAGRMLAPPCVHDATARLARRSARAGYVAVGDAALATERLSSQGVQGALVSALQGVAAVHTLLTQPEDAALALRFHRAGRQDAARRARRQAASMHAAAWQRIGTPFWEARARRAAQDASGAPPAAPDAPATPLRLSPALSIADGPVLDGALIRRGQVLRHPGLDGPIAFLGGVAVAPLLAATAFPAPGPVLLGRWSERIGPTEARRILVWLRQSGLLVAAQWRTHAIIVPNPDLCATFPSTTRGEEGAGCAGLTTSTTARRMPTPSRRAC